MPLADDFRTTLRTLPDDWSEARFAVTFEDLAEERHVGRLPNNIGGFNFPLGKPEEAVPLQQAARAASLLGMINASRHGNEVRFSTARQGADTVLRALRRLDREGLAGELKLVGSAAEPAAAPRADASLAAAWPAEEAKLPPDWTDLYAELDLHSTDYLDGAALLLAPLNPSRVSERTAFRFRVARSFGYGASPQMLRRCLERLDEAGITGELRIVYVLSDTKPVATQGPVWYVGGKVV